MTPAKMFDGDLYVLAADAVQMAENAYKNGQTDEREACAKVCEEQAEKWRKKDLMGYVAVLVDDAASAIRARGQHGD